MDKVKRIEYIENDKYKLKEIYGGFNIYQKITDFDIPICNEWLLRKQCKTGMEIKIVIQCYNNITYDELLDAIDNYCETGLFNYKTFERETYTVVHPNGDVLI